MHKARHSQTFNALLKFKTGKFEAIQTFHSADILLAPPTPEAIMPSSRRSQNLPLEDSLIASSIASRSKKPSGKAKADAAARTIVEAAANKANTAGAAAKADLPRNSKGHIIGNSKAAKKAREAYAAELQRCADAADRKCSVCRGCSIR